MRVIPASYHIRPDQEPADLIRTIERAGRTCYKSEDKITPTSGGKFVRMLINRQHESVLEHANMTIRFVIDRGVSHELVRHRLCAVSQESTRYCAYGHARFGQTITFIDPRPHLDEETFRHVWVPIMEQAERAYFELVRAGHRPEMARSVLPNSLKTEVVVTANMREWRHILKLRTSMAAHPQMREVMVPLLRDLKRQLPDVFFDVKDEPASELEQDMRQVLAILPDVINKTALDNLGDALNTVLAVHGE